MAGTATNKEYELAIKIAGAVSASFNGAIGDAGNKLTNLGSIAQKAAAVAAAAWGALQLGEFISDSISTYQEFEQAMANTSAIASATAEQYKALEAAALEMGKATSKSASECANALGYMLLAGWSVEDSIASLEPVLRLSEATQMDLATCSDLVTDSMSALSLEVKDLPAYLDLVAMANNKSNQTAQMLMEAYIGVGGTLSNLNVPLQESAAAIGVMSNRGIKGIEAGTAFNAILVNLTTGAGQAGKMMKKLGISAFDENGNFIGLRETLQAVSNALGKLSEEERNAALAAIGGKQHGDALNALLSGLNTMTEEGVSEWEALSNELYNCDGAMMQMANTATDTWQGAIARLDSAIDDFKINLVSNFAPYAEEAINAIAAYIPHITEAVMNVIPVFMEYAIPKIVAFKDRAIEVFHALQPALENIGTFVVQTFSFLANAAGTAMQGIAQAISGHSSTIFGNLGQIASNIGGLIADMSERFKPLISYIAETAIPKIAEAVMSIAEKLSGLALKISENKKLVLALVSAFGAFQGITALSALGNKITDITKTLEAFQRITRGTSLVTSAINGQLPALSVAVGILTGKIKLTELAIQAAKAKWNSFAMGIKGIGNLAKTSFVGLKNGLASIGQTLGLLGSRIGAFLSANPAILVIAGITAVIAVLVTLYQKCEWFREKVDAIVQVIKGYLQSFLESAKAVIQNIWTDIQPYLEAVKQAVLGAVSAVINFFQTNVLPGLQAVWNSICGVFQSAWELIKSVWETVKPFFLEVWEDIKVIFSVVAVVLGGFFQAAWIAIQSVWAAVVPWFRAIWTGIKSAFSVAGAVLGGFFRTAWEAIKGIWNTAVAFFQALFDSIAGIFSAVHAVFRGDFSGAWEAVKGIFGGWGSFFQTLWESIKNIFGAAVSWFQGVFSNVWNGIKDVFSAGIDAVKNSWIGFWSTLDQLTGGAVTRIQQFFVGLWDGITSIFGGIASWFQTSVSTPVINVFKPITEAVGGFFSQLWSDIQAVWASVSGWFQDHVITPIVNVFSPILNTLSGIFQACWIIIQAIWKAVAMWFQANVITPLVNFFSTIVGAVGGFFSQLWSDIQAVWASVSGWFQTNVIVPVVGFFSAIPGVVSAFFSQLWADIQAVWSVVAAWFQTNVITPVIGFFSAIPGVVSGFFSQLWTAIQTVWATVASWFQLNVVTPIINFFSPIVASVSGFFSSLWNNIVSIWQAAGSWFMSYVTTPINNAFQAVSDFAKGVFNGLIGFVEGALNGIIGKVNGFIGLLNGAAQAAASFVGVDFGGIPELPSASLPRMAEGGIVNAPTILEAGEAGTEAIIPLSELWSQMQGMVSQVLAHVSTQLPAMTESIENGKSALQVQPVFMPQDQIQSFTPDMENATSNPVAIATEQLDSIQRKEEVPSVSDLLNHLTETQSHSNPKAIESTPVSITYSPQYHFEGDAPSREDLVQAEKLSQEEFNRMAAKWIKDIQRMNFRG